MEALYQTTRGLETTVAQSALHAFVETAKVDHLAFKYEAVEALVEGNVRISEAAADDHACQLGHWIHEGAGKTCFAKLGSFRAMERVHNEFHQRMAKVSAMASASSVDIMQGIAAIDASERELMHALDKLVADAGLNDDVFCVGATEASSRVAT
ncbi:MAG: CZB domain-containing protein [Sterolibacterium sp.]